MMKRTKLADRALPNYSVGEEIMNTVTHIIGGAVGATFGFVSNKLMHTNK